MKQKIIIACLTVLVIVLGIFLIIVIKKDKKSFEYGEVIKKVDQYVIIKANNTTTKITDVNLNVGDVIKHENKTTTIIVSNTTTTKKVIDTQNVVNSIKLDYENIRDNIDSKDIKENAKATFVKIVDFIFYDAEINGVKFKDLTTEAKLTIIKYALLLDNKIDSLFPDYKKEIGEKYNDIKNKLIFEYMNSLTYVCSKNKSECSKFKNEFNELKSKISITWINIKDAFLNSKEKAKNSIEEWYKIFKNS